MRALLIRHGLTRGNLERRYIGCRTDEALCPEGMAALAGVAAPPVSGVFVSPMLRCVQTAALLYPGVEPIVVEDFRECDFGAFEGRSAAELAGDAAYQAWIDSGGELPFPGGESRRQFAERCARAYAALAEEARGDVALVVHGGTIMAVMERFARPAGGYFDFMAPCGGGFVLEADGRYERLRWGEQEDVSQEYPSVTPS